MDNNTTALSGIKGLKPVDPQVIERFRRNMVEKVIPEIIAISRRRRKATRKNRFRGIR